MGDVVPSLRLRSLTLLAFLSAASSLSASPGPTGRLLPRLYDGMNSLRSLMTSSALPYSRVVYR